MYFPQEYSQVNFFKSYETCLSLFRRLNQYNSYDFFFIFYYTQ